MFSIYTYASHSVERTSVYVLWVECECAVNCKTVTTLCVRLKQETIIFIYSSLDEQICKRILLPANEYV